MKDKFGYWLAATLALTIHAMMSGESVAATLLGCTFGLLIGMAIYGIYKLFKNRTQTT